MLQAVHPLSTPEDALTSDRLVHARRGSPSVGPGLEDSSRPGGGQLAEHLAEQVEGDVAEDDAGAEHGGTTTNELGDRVRVEAGLEPLSDKPLELEGGLRDEGDVGLDGLMNSIRSMRSKKSSVREAHGGLVKGRSERGRVPVGRTELAHDHAGHREVEVGVVLEGSIVSSPGGQREGGRSDGGGM